MNNASPRESALDLPPSCRAAADRMEAALREEDRAAYSVAHLNGAACSILREAENALTKELGKDIVLVAYQNH